MKQERSCSTYQRLNKKIKKIKTEKKKHDRGREKEREGRDGNYRRKKHWEKPLPPPHILRLLADQPPPGPISLSLKRKKEEEEEGCALLFPSPSPGPPPIYSPPPSPHRHRHPLPLATCAQSEAASFSRLFQPPLPFSPPPLLSFLPSFTFPPSPLLFSHLLPLLSFLFPLPTITTTLVLFPHFSLHTSAKHNSDTYRTTYPRVPPHPARYNIPPPPPSSFRLYPYTAIIKSYHLRRVTMAGGSQSPPTAPEISVSSPPSSIPAKRALSEGNGTTNGNSADRGDDNENNNQSSSSPPPSLSSPAVNASLSTPPTKKVLERNQACLSCRSRKRKCDVRSSLSISCAAKVGS